MIDFRIHPTIGLARVGNSEEYNLAPETRASMPVEGIDDVDGGLPIKPGTESDHITSEDLRDDDGALKRQAARFHIYMYNSVEEETYPNGGGTPITLGSKVGGRTVKNILWQVHLANKKANNYVFEYPASDAGQIIQNYERGLPPLRNASEGDLDDPDRISRLTIDPGPRTISGRCAGPVGFDKQTIPSYLRHDSPKDLPKYPKSFPSDTFPALYCPAGPVDTLGALETDEQGRLLVVGSYGNACSRFDSAGDPFPLDQPVDNDGWFDDTADGPVSAVIVFDDDSTAEVAGAWVVSTDPAYAPQTINVVTLWDDIFDTWVRKLDLLPDVHDGANYNDEHIVSFVNDVRPFFRAAAVQEFNTYLPRIAIDAHHEVGDIDPTAEAIDTILSGLAFIRNPNNPGESEIGVPLMPLSLGDQGSAFMSPTLTQYFFLQQWNAGKVTPGEGPDLGPGEKLDRASLFNCLAGRFSPGIDMTFIVRQMDLWRTDWKTNSAGPFRIRPRKLKYSKAKVHKPFLTRGYVPVHDNDFGLEPGDTSKFMSIPWHSDYNSCATHPTAPNINNSTTLFWSWPAQRPVSVYVATDVKPADKKDIQKLETKRAALLSDADGASTDRLHRIEAEIATKLKLPSQRYSVRGSGTESDNPANMGRYQSVLDMVTNFPRIGTVIQGSAITEKDNGPFPRHWLLEVASQLEQQQDEPDAEPWPLNATPGTQ